MAFYFLLIPRGGWVGDGDGSFLEEMGALVTGTKIHLFEFWRYMLEFWHHTFEFCLKILSFR